VVLPAGCAHQVVNGMAGHNIKVAQDFIAPQSAKVSLELLDEVPSALSQLYNLPTRLVRLLLTIIASLSILISEIASLGLRRSTTFTHLRKLSFSCNTYLLFVAAT